MTEVNNRVFIVAGVSGDTFQIQDDGSTGIDSSGFTAYTSGGTVQKANTTTIEAHRKFSTNTDIGSFGASAIASFTAGDDLEVYIKNDTAAHDFTHEHMLFSAINLNC